MESAVLAFIVTRYLSSQDEETQEKLLEYAPGAEKSEFQRQVSTKIAKRTMTPEGQVVREEKFENVLVTQGNSKIVVSTRETRIESCLLKNLECENLGM